MPQLSVQNTLLRMKRGASGRPPRLFSGGEVDQEAKQYGREHAEEMSYADRTRRYDKDFRHYYDDGEKGFARGGRVPRRYGEGGQVSDESLSPHQKGDRDEEDAEYQRMTAQLAPQPKPKSKQPGANPPSAYAMGGKVDGAGKVDGVHSSPAECSHLASGGVCRHLAPSRRRAEGEDYSDSRERNYAGGGEAEGPGPESFSGFLAKRRAARSSRNMRGG